MVFAGAEQAEMPKWEGERATNQTRRIAGGGGRGVWRGGEGEGSKHRCHEGGHFHRPQQLPGNVIFLYSASS